MASHPGLEPQPLTLESEEFNQQTSLEAELGPAVLDACVALWREYSELSAMAPMAFPVCGQDLLLWYGELQFKTLGGSRCSQCGASVRHALKIRAERHDGSTRTYLCLCTRCLIAEEAVSGRVLFRVASHWVQARRQEGDSAPTYRHQAA